MCCEISDLVVVVVPSMSRDKILFFLDRCVAVVWKNLVLLSPSSSHFCLALSCQCFSSSKYILSKEHLVKIHSSFSSSVRSRFSKILSRSFNFDKKSSFFSLFLTIEIFGPTPNFLSKEFQFGIPAFGYISII